MAFNEELYFRIKKCLELFPENITSKMSEKKMFGGIAFLLSGKMTVGIVKDELVARVVASKMEEVLQMPHVRPMDFTGKPMKEFVYVAPEALSDESKIHFWTSLGIAHAKEKLNIV